jgi:hypothetical protein
MTNFFTVTKTSEVIELSSTSSEAENSSLERALLWKIDYHILPLLYLAYITTFIDRANIGNVKIEGMLTDLDMKGNDYNIALIVYAVPYILLELPSSLALRDTGRGITLRLLCLVGVSSRENNLNCT